MMRCTPPLLQFFRESGELSRYGNQIFTSTELRKSKLELVHQTVKSKIKSYNEAVKKSMPVQFAITPATLKQVVNSAITGDNKLKNIVKWGLEEAKALNQEDIDDLQDVLFSVTSNRGIY